tara:strand:- start:5320 stop:5685 length:366 start_codon:yes stop_codon:yes gene_type:complete
MVKMMFDDVQEVRVTSETGGQKGSKLEQYDQIPVAALRELARVYGFGASKYAAHNMRLGYPVSLSFSALNRHLWAWQGGEDKDPESGRDHLAHVAWHALTMMACLDDHGARFDDRHDRVQS